MRATSLHTFRQTNKAMCPLATRRQPRRGWCATLRELWPHNVGIIHGRSLPTAPVLAKSSPNLSELSATAAATLLSLPGGEGEVRTHQASPRRHFYSGRDGRARRQLRLCRSRPANQPPRNHPEHLLVAQATELQQHQDGRNSNPPPQQR